MNTSSSATAGDQRESSRVGNFSPTQGLQSCFAAFCTIIFCASHFCPQGLSPSRGQPEEAMDPVCFNIQKTARETRLSDRRRRSRGNSVRYRNWPIDRSGAEFLRSGHRTVGPHEQPGRRGTPNQPFQATAKSGPRLKRDRVSPSGNSDDSGM